MKAFTRLVRSALAWTALQDPPFGVPQLVFWATGLVTIPVATLLGAVLALATIVDPTLNVEAYGGRRALGAGLVVLWALLFPIVMRIARRVDSSRESAQSRQFLVWSVLVTGSIFFAAVALAWLVNRY